MFRKLSRSSILKLNFLLKEQNMDKIILFGFFGSGNIGNDSTLEAALYHVKKYQPDANIICVCNGPREVSRRFGIQALPMSGHEAR